MKTTIKLLAAGLLVLIIAGCTYEQPPVETKNSEFTQGNVQMNIEVGKTTKADILEAFGSPNTTTRVSDGTEVWSYQRAAQISQSTYEGSSFNILIAGASGSSSGLQTSSRMSTIIIYFNSQDIVVDFKSRTSDF